ncbi:MAG: Nif11-like leader peptide family RiPP precursor [Rivularia sp. (in: cyanobacteria)]|jgi:predicted ribosomally synthesized peptide with nif11-like leader
MSIEAVSEFLEKVSHHEKLQQELLEIMEFNENDQVRVTELAAKHGFDFTPNELLQQVEQLHSDEQLNDEELEYVAGGSQRDWRTVGNLVDIFSQGIGFTKDKV